MSHRERVLLVIVGVLSLGMMSAGVGLVVLYNKADHNQAAIGALVAAVKQGQADAAAARADAAAQRQLVLALQRQVRRLGGRPLTAPPTPPVALETPAAATGNALPPSTATPSTRPTRPPPSPTPSPSRTPHPSPTPTPSPTCIVRPVCLPGGSR